jgi:hypothetical protein
MTTRRPHLHPLHDDLSFDALLIGGRAGVGKTAMGFEVSAQFQAAGVAHCFIEGDNLDQAFPAPPGDPARTLLTEANLAALWRNYAALGYRRLIYTNTVSVLESDMITRAMGGTVRVTAILLTAHDTTAAHRLTVREIGCQLDAHLARGTAMARHLATTAPGHVRRVATDNRTVTDIATEIIAATSWATPADELRQVRVSANPPGMNTGVLPG